ncbi:MAG: LuxR C-terminal-related transcriptional regulator [Planctomycetota bacterium]
MGEFLVKTGDDEGFPDLLLPKQWQEIVERYGLTTQEQRVLRLLCRGLGNTATARRLGIGLPTLRTYLRSIYRKLGCIDRVAVILALVHGFAKN